MVAVDAVLHVTVLAISARIQASEESDSIELVLVRVIFVLEGAVAALGAGTAEEVVVTEFVVIFSFFDVLQDRLVEGDRRVEATRAGVPRRRLRLGDAARAHRGLERDGKRDLRGRAGF